MEYILQINNLRKDYGGFSLKDISFSLPRGYIIGFIGPNGAGKTTTIKLIMNLLKKDGGEIKVFGLDNVKEEQEIKSRIGFVYEENYYYEELTVMEIKRVIAPYYDKWDDQKFNKFIEYFNLPVNKKTKTLSKGMKMKFSLALALSHDAELLIMDEPTSGLDPVIRSEILDILREYMADENKGILLSSHLISDLDKIADYICFIDEGEIVLSSSKEELLEKYAVVKGEKRFLVDELRGLLFGLRENDYGFTALTRDAAKMRRLYNDSLVIERPTLEDIMLYTIRGKKDV